MCDTGCIINILPVTRCEARVWHLSPVDIKLPIPLAICCICTAITGGCRVSAYGLNIQISCYTCKEEEIWGIYFGLRAQGCDALSFISIVLHLEV